LVVWHQQDKQAALAAAAADGMLFSSSSTEVSFIAAELHGRVLELIHAMSHGTVSCTLQCMPV
jgi:hypothetical protein